LQPVQVHIGITDNKDYEIIEGLKEGDVVATGSIGGAAPAAQQANNPFGGPFGGRGGGGGRR
jgi:2-keto-4-pentenoate hydratase